MSNLKTVLLQYPQPFPHSYRDPYRQLRLFKPISPSLSLYAFRDRVTRLGVAVLVAEPLEADPFVAAGEALPGCIRE